MISKKVESIKDDLFLIKVENFLMSIEKTYNLTIIFACETGSRAHGTAIDSSDYDIKGIYIKQQISFGENYVSNPKYDFREIDNLIDFEFYEINFLLNELLKGKGRPLR